MVKAHFILCRNFLTCLAFFGAVLCLSAEYSHAAPSESFPVVKLKSLDKVTARTMTFEIKVGSTVKFGPLFIKAQSCKKSLPIEQPESAAFLQIWEVDTQEDAHWIFSGWMFASSPALSPMDHAIYDVWVLDCLQEQGAGKEDDELRDNQIPDQPHGQEEGAQSDDSSTTPQQNEDDANAQ